MPTDRYARTRAILAELDEEDEPEEEQELDEDDPYAETRAILAELDGSERVSPPVEGDGKIPWAVPYLSGITMPIRAVQEMDYLIPKDILRETLRLAPTYSRGFAASARAPLEGVGEGVGADLGGAISTVLKPFKAPLGELASRAPQAEEAIGSLQLGERRPFFEEFAERPVTAVARAVAQQVPMLASSFAAHAAGGPPAALANIFLLETGELDRSLEELAPEMPEEERARWAITGGLVASSFEYVGIHRLARIAGGQAVVQKGIRRVAQAGWTQGLTESVTETPQEATAIMVEVLSGARDGLWTFENAIRLLEAGTIGLVVGSVAGGVAGTRGGVSREIVERARQRAAEAPELGEAIALRDALIDVKGISQTLADLHVFEHLASTASRRGQDVDSYVRSALDLVQTSERRVEFEPQEGDLPATLPRLEEAVAAPEAAVEEEQVAARREDRAREGAPEAPPVPPPAAPVAEEGVASEAEAPTRKPWKRWLVEDKGIEEAVMTSDPRYEALFNEYHGIAGKLSQLPEGIRTAVELVTGEIVTGELGQMHFQVAQSAVGDDFERVKSTGFIVDGVYREGTVPGRYAEDLAKARGGFEMSQEIVDLNQVRKERLRTGEMQPGREREAPMPGLRVEGDRFTYRPDEDTDTDVLEQSALTIRPAHAAHGYADRDFPLELKDLAPTLSAGFRYGRIMNIVDLDGNVKAQFAVREVTKLGSGGYRAKIDIEGQGPGALGIRAMRQVLREAARKYPLIKEWSGWRVSGARERFHVPDEDRTQIVPAPKEKPRRVQSTEEQLGLLDEAQPMAPQVLKQAEGTGPTASQVASSAIGAHSEFGGSTINTATGQSFAGQDAYVAGAFKERERKIKGRPLTPEDVERYMRDNEDLLRDDRYQLGTWHDTKNEQHVLDVVEVVPTLDDAVAVARREGLGEDAVWDLKAFREIPTKKYELLKRAPVVRGIPTHLRAAIKRAAVRTRKLVGKSGKGRPDAEVLEEIRNIQRAVVEGAGEDAELQKAAAHAQAAIEIAAFLRKVPYQEAGLDWHVLDRELAVDRMVRAGLLPERVRTDETWRTVYSALVGIMSPNRGVKTAEEEAAYAIRMMVREGSNVLPIERPSMTVKKEMSNFGVSAPLLERFQRLIDDLGLEGAAEYLVSEHSISELRERYSDARGRQDERRIGFELFGPKAGRFGANAHGISRTPSGDPIVTVDSWMVYWFNRLMGQTDQPLAKQKKQGLESEVVRREVTEFVDRLAGRFGIDVADMQAVIWTYERAVHAGLGKSGASGEGNILRLADEIIQQRRPELAPYDQPRGPPTVSPVEARGPAAEREGSVRRDRGGDELADLGYDEEALAATPEPQPEGPDTLQQAPPRRDRRVADQVEGPVEKGRIEFDPVTQRASIIFTEAADASTVVHELGHLIRRTLPGEDQALLEKAYRVKNGRWTEEQEERFARNLERYFRTRRVPAGRLGPAFAELRDRMTETYREVRGSSIRSRIPLEVRELFEEIALPESEAVDRPAGLPMRAETSDLEIRGAGLPSNVKRAGRLEPADARDPIKVQAARAEVIEKLEKLSGVKVRVGRGSFALRKALGWFNPKLQIIRQAVANDIETATHETGHAIHKKLKDYNVTAIPPQARKELAAIGRELYGDTRPAGGYVREGFAELFSRTLLGDDMATSSPAAMAWFENEFLSDEKFVGQFDDIKRTIRNYFTQGAPATAASQFHRLDGPLKERVKTAYGKARELFSYRKWWDNDEAVLRALNEFMEERGIDPESVPPSIHPYKVRRAFAMTAPGSAKHVIYRAMVKTDGDSAYRNAGKSLADVLEPIVEGRPGRGVKLWKKSEREEQLERFFVYAYARRAAFLHTRKIDPGISKEVAVETVRQLENDTFREASDGLTNWANGLLDIVVEAGGLSPEAAQTMKDANPIYLPLKRWFDDHYRRYRMQAGGGSGELNVGRPYKGIKGSGRQIVHPLEALALQAEYVFRVANKMQVGKALVEFSDKYGAGDIAHRVPKERHPQEVSLETLERELRKLDVLDRRLTKDEKQKLVTIFNNAMFPSGADNIVTVWRNGKLEWWEVEPGIYDALLNVGVEHVPELVRYLGAPKRAVQLGAVGLNPNFLFRNLFRDALSRVMLTATRPVTNILGRGRKAPPKPWESVNGIVMKLRDDPAAVLYSAAGLEMTTVMGQDRLAARRRVEESLIGRGKKKKRTTVTVAHPVDGIRELFSLMETSTRMVEFKEKLEEAEEKWGEGSRDALIEAMLASKEVTTDFTRWGAHSRILGQMIPFFNPALQGVDRFYRGVTGQRGISGKAYAKRAAKKVFVRGVEWITLPSIALWFMNRDKEWYQELNEYERWNYWHLEPVEGTIVRLPKPFELGHVFGSLPEGVLDAIYQQDPDIAVEAAFETFKRFMPPTQVAAALWREVVPERGWDEFREREIDYERQLPLPPDRYDEWTTETAKALGKMLNYSPRKIQHLIESYSGGLAIDFMRYYELFLLGKESQRDKIKGPHQIPVVGTFFLRDPYAGARSTEEFYDRLDLLKQTDASNRKNGWSLEKRQAASYYKEMRRLEKVVEQMRKVRNDAKTGDQIKAANKRIARLARAALKGD